MYIIWGRGLSEKTENRQDNSTTEKPAGKFDDGASARQPVKAKRGRDMRATLLATGETEFEGMRHSAGGLKTPAISTGN